MGLFIRRLAKAVLRVVGHLLNLLLLQAFLHHLHLLLNLVPVVGVSLLGNVYVMEIVYRNTPVGAFILQEVHRSRRVDLIVVGRPTVGRDKS